MKNKGWIRLHRKILDNPIWSGEMFTRGQAWLDMLMMTAHAETYVRIRGVRINLMPGQLALSEREFSERWKWSRGKVERFLNDLEAIQQIITQKTNVTTLVTIVNWKHYQAVDTTDSATNETTSKTTSRTTDGPIQECIRIKSIKEDTKTPTASQYPQRGQKSSSNTGFDEFWADYERKGSKKATKAAWDKLAPADQKKARESLIHYFVEKPERQYRKDAERYLRDRVFEDVLERTEFPALDGADDGFGDDPLGLRYHAGPLTDETARESGRPIPAIMKFGKEVLV
ncbi:MAG: hypothetical protein JW808_08025 [Victivallales bacterium]|nr:hypothetical protein [Victivallales bacterium]